MGTAPLATFVAFACVLSGRVAAAQCADGSPPPCRGSATAPVLDPGRIAVLPFRVTTADTLFGEGVAELVALELSNGSGLRPVHMGSALSAWRAAGGGLRTPLPVERATRVARGLGAGQLLEGSVVGTASRITIAASLVSAVDGSTTRVAPVIGHPDSVDILARRVSVAIISALGRETRAATAYRLTESAEALRAYLEGLSAWRHRRYARALGAFERAVTADSSFASAAYARFRAGQYVFDASTTWEKLAWRHQHRLPDEERVVLRALLGPNYPAPRRMKERLADLEEAVRLAPESPEALYHLGDFLFHYGSALGYRDTEARSEALLDRSIARDTQSTVFSHLFAGPIRRADSAALRRLWKPYEAFFGAQVDRRLGWIVALTTNDTALRRRMERDTVSLTYFMADLPQTGLGAAALEAMKSVSLRWAPGSAANWLGYAHGAVLQGRPAAATRALMEWRPADGGLLRDAFLIAAAVVSDADTQAADSAAVRLGRFVGRSDTDRARAQCAVSLWDEYLMRGGEWSEAILREHGQENCALILAAMRAARLGTLTVSALLETDSMVAERLAVDQYLAIENLILARLWEKLGDPRRALASAHRVHTGYPLRAGLGGSGSNLSAAASARVEGRLAAQLGDTTGAVAAYTRYLLMRRDAEPVLVPQRDSVRAELARLTGKPASSRDGRPLSQRAGSSRTIGVSPP